MEVVATGLMFPEGPVAMPDGSMHWGTPGLPLNFLNG